MTIAVFSQAKFPGPDLLFRGTLCLPQTPMLNVTLCGNRVIVEVISSNEVILD